MAFVLILAWSFLCRNENVTGIHTLFAEPLKESGPMWVVIRHSESLRWVDLKMKGC